MQDIRTPLAGSTCPIEMVQGYDYTAFSGSQFLPPTEVYVPMTNGFAIPDRQKEAFSRLLALPERTRAAMVNALVAAKPALTIGDFAEAVNKKAEIPPTEIVEIIRMFGGMYLARAEAATEVAEFADGITALAKQHLPNRDRKRTTSFWGRFRDDLIKVLSAEASLGTTAKALTVVGENERLVCADNTRVVTDIRPVFGQDVKKMPHAGVITHLLKIAYHEGSEMELKETYFAMVATDVRTIRRLLDRALAKEATLRAHLEKGGFQVLEADSPHGH